MSGRIVRRIIKRAKETQPLRTLTMRSSEERTCIETSYISMLSRRSEFLMQEEKLLTQNIDHETH